MSTTITLEDKDVDMFKIFMREYDIISICLENDVFTFSNGNVILSYDSNGTLRKIKKEQVVFNS